MTSILPTLNLFDTTIPESTSRFGRSSLLFDPSSRALIARLGIAEGWSCLEIGDGGGSMTHWLARQVGRSGYVHSVDLDTTRLESSEELSNRASVEISRADIAAGVPGDGQYDLIHTRLCLMEIPERVEVLRSLTGALRPGGWLLVEDFDPHIINRGYATRDAEAAGLHHRMCAAMGRVFATRGVEVGWGRSLHGRLRDLGLVDTGMSATLSTWEGGSAGALIDIANFEEVREAVVSSGSMTDAEIDRLIDILRDPTFEISSPLLCSAWGRRRAI